MKDRKGGTRARAKGLKVWKYTVNKEREGESKEKLGLEKEEIERGREEKKREGKKEKNESTESSLLSPLKKKKNDFLVRFLSRDNLPPEY